MPGINVVVAYGGWGAERELSIQSAPNLRETLMSSGLEVRLVEVGSGDGTIKVCEDDCIGADAFGPSTIAFPYVFGPGGEDGRLVRWLVERGHRYYGPSPRACVRSFRKDYTNRTLKRAGLKVAAEVGLVARGSARWPSGGVSRYPVIVKPRAGGSSLGLTLVEEPRQLSTALENCFLYDDFALIEEFIPFEREYAVACFEWQGRVFSYGAELLYDQKIFGAQAKRARSWRCAERMLPAAHAEIADLAASAYRALRLSGLCRFDLVKTPDGLCYVIECDAVPGHGHGSLCETILRMWEINYSEVMLRLLTSAGQCEAGRLRTNSRTETAPAQTP